MRQVGRRRPDRPQRPGALRRVASLVLGVLLVASAACAGGSGRGPLTLNWYSFPDDSGALQQAADTCSTASHGQYKIVYQKLPRSADGQRQQLVRRLAARDAGLDIMSLDVTWEAEFAEAGWAEPWTGSNRQRAEDGTLKAALDTATWKGQLVAVPYNTNTQLLWYRSDLVPTPPKTWDEMIQMSEQLARAGKPHLIETQGAQYEGAAVWFTTMDTSAGGSILNPDATAPAIDDHAISALRTMSKFAHSVGADPSLSNQMEDDNRLAMENGVAAFELNYPFVYPSIQKNKPELAKVFKWARYPAVVAGTPSRVTIGGIDLAVSPYSKHKDPAFQAALCLRNTDNQKVAAIKGGLPPTLSALYNDPEFVKNYPFAADIKAELDDAAVRPKTPAYQNISIVISHLVSPPSSIQPQSVADSLRGQISDALDSKGLIP